MRISARQAWHDCFYIPKDDALARIRELTGQSDKVPTQNGVIVNLSGSLYLKVWAEEEGKDGNVNRIQSLIPLLKAKSDARPAKDFFLAWDPIWRAKVQTAIKALPVALRRFGHYMYAPTTESSDEQTEQVQDAIKMAYYSSFKPEELIKWRSARFEQVNYLAFAVMHFYRRWAFGTSDNIARPSEIGTYLYEEFGARIPHIVKNWERDWKSPWNAMIAIVDEYERQTLGPIARAVAEFYDESPAHPSGPIEEMLQELLGDQAEEVRDLVSLDDLPHTPRPILSLNRAA